MSTAPRTREETTEILALFKTADGAKKMPWAERVKMIEDYWPSVKRLDWDKAFRQDPTLLGRILNDIIKMEAATPGQPGKRPNVSREETEKHLRRLTGEDYTIHPFNEALRYLRKDKWGNDKSVRHLARKFGMNRDYTWRLLTGKRVPTVDDMERVAAAFDKHPSYFVEYRVAYLVGFLYDRMTANPEASVLQYRRVNQAAQGDTDERH